MIATVAALAGDPGRANMLVALVAGTALTASELAAEAGITPQTASAHLARLESGGLVRVRRQGRHRYFMLADGDVARMLEAMMGVASRAGLLRARPGPADPALRTARRCYDHLAGEKGVAVLDGLLARRLLTIRGETLLISPEGNREFARFGLDFAVPSRRPLCLTCLDWSQRRSHLAGRLGAALLTQMLSRGWASPAPDSRALRFTARGERELARWFLK